MKGKVLGSDSAGGTISGEDGKRYKFASTSWKSERSPAPGDEVDFEVQADGAAGDVYSIRSGVSLDFGAVGGQAKALLGEHANSPMGAHVLTLLKGNVIFQIALVIIVASCFLTFVKLNSTLSALSPGAVAALPNQGVVKVIGTASVVDFAKTTLDAGAASMDQFDQIVGQNTDNLFAQPGQANPLGNPKAIASQLRAAALYANLLYLLYLIPIGALAIVVQLIRKKSLSLIPLVTGVVCIASFALLVFARSALISAVKKAANASLTELAGKVIVFGLGSYVILLCGLALVAVILGFVRLPQRTA